MEKQLFIKHDFVLNPETIKRIQSKVANFGYGTFSEIVYYRTYSRKKEDGSSEDWNDTIIRVVTGLFSILKSHILEHHLPWDEKHWQDYSNGLIDYMFDMKFMCPGRGLWIMGTGYVKERGSMALNNCGFVSTEDLVKSATWTTNALMAGCGIGFDTEFKGEITYPTKTIEYMVEDSREGWANSVGYLIAAYLGKNIGEFKNEMLDPVFNYSKVRPSGAALKGFGGVSAGPDPLIKLHKRIKTYLLCMAIKQVETKGDTKPLYEKVKVEVGEEYHDYAKKSATKYSNTRLVADIFNAIGSCVVAGNIRRSSEIALGKPDDPEFVKLKDVNVNPERSDISWMSNNTVKFTTVEEFSKYIPSIAKQIVESGNGEPGILNMLNVQRYGRVNKHYDQNDPWTRERETDKAIGVNPCSEINLESYELCNLSEIFIGKCLNVNGEFSEEIFYKAVEYASFYASVVSLLPTDSPESNKVIARNHRLGVSLSGTALVSEKLGYSATIELLKNGYKKVREVNNEIMDMAGVPRSIRVTAIKPSGTISLLAGVPPGIHFPIESRYIIRRIRVAMNSELVPYLTDMGLPCEKDTYADNTLVFEYPLDQGDIRPIKDVSVWEQLQIAKLYNKWWSDNSVSVTIQYNKNEASSLEEAIALTIPDVKCLSFLPNSDTTYVQQPIEGISYEKYLELKSKLKNFNLTEYRKKKSDDTAMPNYCDGDKCVL